MMFLLLLACGSSESSQTTVPRTGGARGGEQHPQDNAEEPTTGRWNRARDVHTDEIAALEAIGYVGGETIASGPGVVSVHTDASGPGYNFFVSGHAAQATLMDASGKVLHTWSKPFREVWPERTVHKSARGPEFWRRATLLPDGSILAIYEGHGLVKVDKESNVVWAWRGSAHHDLALLDDGSMWVLARKARVIPEVNKRPVLEDFAVLLGPDGVERKRVSIVHAVQSGMAAPAMKRLPKRHGDLFHTNSLEVLTGSVPHAGFEKGNLLLSMRTMSTIMVLDPNTEQITWWHHGDYSKQHDPTILDNGNLLLFDNLGTSSTTSAVKEYHLPDMKQVWAFEGSVDTPFFSRFCGAAQRLPNGNTLISESGVGHAMEVTHSGEVVWAWDNPNRAGDDGEFVAIVPELQRVPPESVSSWLTVEGTP